MSESDDEFVVAVAAYYHCKAITDGFLLNMVATSSEQAVYDDQLPSQRGPGKGNARDGLKAQYVRQNGKGDKYYMDIRQNRSSSAFEDHTGYTEQGFNELYRLVENELQLAMDPRFEVDHEAIRSKRSRRRQLKPDTMLFMFLHFLRESIDGNVGYGKLSALYGISAGTVSNYIKHVATALLTVLGSNDSSQKIEESSDYNYLKKRCLQITNKQRKG